jgi:hypothetical protein
VLAVPAAPTPDPVNVEKVTATPVEFVAVNPLPVRYVSVETMLPVS